MPALSAQRGSFSRCPVQHRLIFAAHPNGCAGMRLTAWRFCSHFRRFASLSKSYRASARTAGSRFSAFAANETEPRHQEHSGFPVRRFSADRLRPAPFDQSPHRGVRLRGSTGCPACSSPQLAANRIVLALQWATSLRHAQTTFGQRPNATGWKPVLPGNGNRLSRLSRIARV